MLKNVVVTELICIITIRAYRNFFITYPIHLHYPEDEEILHTSISLQVGAYVKTFLFDRVSSQISA